MNFYDVIIAGAGPAGLMCAIGAAQRNRSVIVVDKGREPGRKLLMSGGGRCNFTNYNMGSEFFISHNSLFCKSALSRFSQWDFIEILHEHGIEFEERDHGQLFCVNSSRNILDLLLNECRRLGVILRSCSEISAVQRISQENENNFQIRIGDESIFSSSLVMATGGLSIPSSGAGPIGYEIARQFGHNVWKPRAGLVPLTFQPSEKAQFSQLSGIAVKAMVRCNKRSFLENILFTHRGLSGPAILQISSFWSPGEKVHLDLLPGKSMEDILNPANRTISGRKVKTVLGDFFPKRLIAAFLPESLSGISVRSLTPGHIRTIQDKLGNWMFIPAGTEGFRTAEVTLGGVDCDEIYPKTMESRKVPGLYFIGEVLDVTGWLGGYNLQWAWSSGWSAGRVV
ncbi:MAG: aminoacetone oxidase family FAD-binding enzyme [Candidatus Wallbacteria bacterium HGW-Wallbacteria-1]|jgi:hypothetical protein|uniref:Aminoacetone oxidase family FAD-binding enzyme n=1 Tax=Candidatus Wallbacteria bacterium HGW-Wallbacteria-1 TaxID=2013854 RepID=A0A2N1PLE7_9BACT|nr:MAG: aminoacetone oxidase family FAD-binding enzyme [Candidatus Wallbacteria bacterium HGW-Wallbacteria-1]